MAESEVKQGDAKAAEPTGTKEGAVAAPATVLGKRGMAAAIIGAHTLQHAYINGFYVILPILYKQLGMVPIMAGVLDTSRWVASGASGMASGFVVDLYRHRRGFILGLSLLMLAGGYLLVSVAPGYAFILLALVFAHIGSAIWHPPGLGLLSEHFPRRRGLLIALHRSSGSVGDTVGPLLIGFLLTWITWQQTLQFGFPVALLISVVLWLTLWNVGGSRVERVNHKVEPVKQWAAFRGITRGSGLMTLFIVSALRGMGDRAIMLFLPLYLANILQFDPARVGLYLGMLTVLAIGSGPVVGAISDRVGRRPMIVVAMLVSAIFPPFMVWGGDGTALTVSVVLFGIFLYSVNSLVQAAAMDVAHGLKLEGTFIGLLWGNNALFSAVSPVIAGALVTVFGFAAAFYYAAATYLLGGLLALRLSLRQAPGV